MEQKDIDRLLICRKAIDDHRARKATSRSTYDTVTTANKASAYDTMQTGFTSSTEEYLVVLADNGFKSVDDFLEFNSNMCIAALKEFIPNLYGKCEGCKHLASPPCKDAKVVPSDLSVGDECFYLPSNTAPKDWQLVALRQVLDAGQPYTINSKGELRMVCPDGYGWYSKPTSDSLPFVVTWR